MSVEVQVSERSEREISPPGCPGQPPHLLAPETRSTMICVVQFLRQCARTTPLRRAKRIRQSSGINLFHNVSVKNSTEIDHCQAAKRERIPHTPLSTFHLFIYRSDNVAFRPDTVLAATEFLRKGKGELRAQRVGKFWGTNPVMLRRIRNRYNPRATAPVSRLPSPVVPAHRAGASSPSEPREFEQSGGVAPLLCAVDRPWPILKIKERKEHCRGRRMRKKGQRN